MGDYTCNMEPKDEREEANEHAPIELLTPEDLEQWGYSVENDFEPMSRESKKIRKMRNE